MKTVPDVKWSFEGGVVVTECDAEYPTLWFMFDEKWIEVAAKDYLFTVETGECIFFILPANLPMNILGMPLFTDYYTIHDPITGTVGWAPHSASTK
jgi:hypothetical protein